MSAPPRPFNVDVPDLLQRLGIQAKRRGRDWWARCPLSTHGHAERTASWRLHDEPGQPKHGLHVCYGCGGGGGPVALARDVLGLEPAAAREWVGSGEPADLLPRIEVAIGASPLRRFALPEGVRFRPFEDWPEVPRRYAEGRGLGAAQVDRWGIGYAVDGDLGGRIVIPVRASDGRIAAYVGRAFLGSLHRYEEPTEGDGADLGVMFGEEHWPAPGAERRHLWLAEGSFDALAIERAVGGPVAALRGSQFGDFDAAKGGAMHGLRRLATISTFAAVTVVTDPDHAGDKAAEAVREAAGRWCQLRRALLPRGTDAAKLAIDAPAELLRRLRDAVPLDLGR